MENNHSFEFTYSAEQQQEIMSIREKYLPKGEDKMETLRKLHSIPTRKAQAGSIALGLMGALVLGTGMSLKDVIQAGIPGIILGLMLIVPEIGNTPEIIASIASTMMSLIILLVNREYFRRRASLFVND